MDLLASKARGLNTSMDPLKKSAHRALLCQLRHSENPWQLIYQGTSSQQYSSSFFNAQGGEPSLEDMIFPEVIPSPPGPSLPAARHNPHSGTDRLTNKGKIGSSENAKKLINQHSPAVLPARAYDLAYHRQLNELWD
ncbi:hypothetical protein NQZ68_005765 [Dissostichus eleginoides]|nr:hypothetical protein NQZ68_005765 [Dissostichus eleginoides]